MVALLLCATAEAQQARLSMHRVDNTQSRVTLTWQAEVEQDVAGYEISRRTPTSTGVVLLSTLTAHGAGKPYLYTDAELYKDVSAIAEYQLAVVFRNGTRQLLFTEQVNYTSTGLRRTWGSLKAMFQ